MQLKTMFKEMYLQNCKKNSDERQYYRTSTLSNVSGVSGAHILRSLVSNNSWCNYFDCDFDFFAVLHNCTKRFAARVYAILFNCFGKPGPVWDAYRA